MIMTPIMMRTILMIINSRMIRTISVIRMKRAQLRVQYHLFLIVKIMLVVLSMVRIMIIMIAVIVTIMVVMVVIVIMRRMITMMKIMLMWS